jgi:predicted ribosome quality control (RQC) complex YloA/Tae2 family protein
MTLDVWLVGRLALELDERLRGARVQSMRSEPLGLVVACHRRGGPVALVASLAPESPMLAAIEGDAEEHESGPGGWAGAVAALLRNATIEAVHAVPDDRIINVDLSSRSAFGVPSRHRLVFELEPRKANALVLRPIDDDGGFSVLAVAKAIAGAEGARDIAVGKPYEPPPSRAPRDDMRFVPAPALDDEPTVDGEPRTVARRLSAADPSCSPPLAREAVHRALLADGTAPSVDRAREEWLKMRPEVERNAGNTSAPIYAYTRGGTVGACHCIPLSWSPGTLVTHASLNEVCSETLASARRKRNAPLASALRKRLGIMLGRCADEMTRLRAAQTAATEADALRLAGDAIYANLSGIAMGETQFTTSDGLVVALDARLEPKENAQSYFKRFRKARSGLPRIAGRLLALEANRALWEQMLWEVERAEESGDDSVFEEVAEAIDLRRSRHAPAQRVRARTERTVLLPSGATAHVGRSPKDNERVTFTIAGPDDLWFHARGIPGAHVVIRTADGHAAPTDEDILAAAALAAGQSRAAAAGKVEVDYTRRKYVRKQGKGRPGLVWYTDFKTVLVTPRKLPVLCRPLWSAGR